MRACVLLSSVAVGSGEAPLCLAISTEIAGPHDRKSLCIVQTPLYVTTLLDIPAANTFSGPSSDFTLDDIGVEKNSTAAAAASMIASISIIQCHDSYCIGDT